MQIGFGFSLPLPRRCQSEEVITAHESWSLVDVGMERDILDRLVTYSLTDIYIYIIIYISYIKGMNELYDYSLQ